MNVLDIVARERPEVVPLDPTVRDQLRARLLDGHLSDSLAPRLVEPPENALVSSNDLPRRRFLTSIAAVLILGVALAALIVATTRPTAVAPAGPVPAATLESARVLPPYSPVTTPVIEELPIPAPVDGGEERDELMPLGTAAPLGEGPPGFAPIVLSAAPAGYELVQARYLPGPDGYGIARYSHPDHDTEIQIISRASTGRIRDLMIEFDRTTWEIAGRTVYNDGELDGCLVDVCSIGSQWDDRTFMSVMWVHPEAGSLQPEASIESLLDLFPLLIEDESQWSIGQPDPNP